MKKWKLNVLHMSHTDIGYTDTQSRILVNQVNYLKDIVKEYNEDRKKFINWVWITESFYIVELFWEQASKTEKETFLQLARKGIISVTSGYLNMSELANEKLFEETLKRACRFTVQHKLRSESVVTNDVNGYSIGYANALANNNIKNLYFGLHSHHGMYPCFKKQHPFYWETSSGKKILVWIGEHYQFGNQLGLVDCEFGNYVLQSSFPDGFYNEEEQISKGLERLKVYLDRLEKSGYPFDNIPVSVLGENIDNAPYNLNISKRIAKMNKIWTKELNVEVKMTNLDEFFDAIRKENKEIPTYKGDWPDWWTDGVGSTPIPGRQFRKAQRNYNAIKDLGIKSPLIADLEENLMLYAEHTWGWWGSMGNPFHDNAREIESHKISYATNALAISSDIIDKHTNRRVHKLEKKQSIDIQIENPYPCDMKIKFYINDFLSHKEQRDFSIFGMKAYVDNKPIESIFDPKRKTFYVVLDMKFNKKIMLTVKQDKENKFQMTFPTSMKAADGVIDTYNPLNNDVILIHDKVYTNDHFKIKWNENEIYSLISLKTNKELLDSSQEGLFTPVFELGAVDNEEALVGNHRRRTGRNKKTQNTVKYVGKIKEVRVHNETKNYTVIEFRFQVKGTQMYSLKLELLNSTKTINATVIFIKDIGWGLENFYVSLPFARNESKVKIDKGEFIQIWKDQLPGTLIDYYSIQEGVKIESSKEDLLISTPDSNLIWTGPMTYQKRFLAHDDRNTSSPVLYAWLMNNTWETNFSANIAGFHQFKFNVYIPGEKISDVNSIDKLKVLNETYITNRKI